MRTPPPLRRGDRIGVVAPAGPAPRARLLAGLAWLRGRYDVVYSPAIFARDGFLAGSDESRREDFCRMLARDDLRAVFAARGGWGSLRVALDVALDRIVEQQMWLVGFSDITTIHLELARRGCASIHGPNVTGLGVMDATARQRAGVVRALESPEGAWSWEGLRTLSRGTGQGRLFGGNLTLLFMQAAAGRLVVPEGAVVCIEDVTEKPYQLDRMLTALRIGGHFSNACAVVFGDFTSCHPGPDGVAVGSVLSAFARDVGLPVVDKAPFGHGTLNDAFVLGRMVVVDATRGVVAAAAISSRG